MKTSIKILAFALSLLFYTGINAQTTNPYPGTNPSTNPDYPPSTNPNLNDTTDRMNRTTPTNPDKTKMNDTANYKKRFNKNSTDTSMTRPSYQKQQKSKATENDTLK